jgi:hypothetical protein
VAAAVGCVALGSREGLQPSLLLGDGDPVVQRGGAVRADLAADAVFQRRTTTRAPDDLFKPHPTYTSALMGGCGQQVSFASITQIYGGAQAH